MPVGSARPKTSRLLLARAGYPCALVVMTFLLGLNGLQNTVAKGETPTISMPSAQAPLKPPPAATTIAIKRSAGQTVSVIVAAPATPNSGTTAAAKFGNQTGNQFGNQFSNPWLVAMIVSPSVRDFLTTLRLGAQDFRRLAALLHKPASVVIMTFATDPYPGLSQHRFSGTAIVFVSAATTAPTLPRYNDTELH